MAIVIGDLIVKNQQRWEACKVNPEKLGMAERAAKMIEAGQARYQSVATLTHVPWWAIGVIHYREASLNWLTHLSNGDPLHEITRDVPRGEPAFNTWEQGAYDALVNEPPHLSKWKDWSPGGVLTALTEYNGFGYDEKGLPSPYIWAGTTQYNKGLYVADGRFNPNAVDPRVGCAAILLALGVLKQ